MKPDKRIRIVFADDHMVVRDGLRTLFRSDPRFSIVGEAADGEAVVELATRVRPDIAILDISMPKLTGIDATRLIKERLPKTRILILTIHESEEFVLELIHAGASGYVLKNAEKKEILAAVRTVAAGESYFSPTVSKMLIEGIIRKSKDGVRSHDSVLTPRELEIVRGIAEGLTNREIARKLGISNSTVNTHRSNVMVKLDIHDTAGLVRYAIKHEILKVPT